MSVVVEHDEELYSLWVDSVGDVLSLSMQDIEKPPANLPVQWRDVASGIFKLKDELMVIMDVAAVLDIGKE